MGRILAVSGVYRSRAVGPGPAPDFLNAAVLVETGLNPARVREQLRLVERELGRVRTADRYAPRTLDLDLCLLGDLQLVDGDLRLPDPDVLERAYLAWTLAELEPSRAYPGTGEPLASIARRLGAPEGLTPVPEVEAAVRAAARPPARP